MLNLNVRNSLFQERIDYGDTRWMTPMRELFFVGGAYALAKLEGKNPSGSHKHRIAMAKINALIRTGRIGIGQSILLLSSSGRMAEAIAKQTAGIEGLRLIVVSDTLSPIALLNVLAAFPHVDLIVVNDPDASNSHMAARFRVVDSLKMKYPNAIYIDQYADGLLPLAYQESLVQEVLEQTGGDVSVVFVPIGTGAMMRAFYVEKLDNHRRFHIQPVDVEGSNATGPSNGKPRHFSGIGNGRSTEFCRLCKDSGPPIRVEDVAIVKMAHRLLIREQLCVGPSSAAVAVAFEQATRMQPSPIPHWGVPVLIFPDDGELYRDTLYNDDWLIANDLGRAISGP